MKILVLAPHTDDGELGMGGTIHRLIEEGNEVHYAAFSTAEQSLPDSFEKGTLLKEVQSATRSLGIASENLHVYQYEVRKFSYHRQEILEDIIKLRADVGPEMVFSPTTNDLHQDHLVISSEGIRAFKKINLLAYELPWNNLNFRTDYFMELNENNLQAKLDALSKYASQEGRDYFDPAFIRSLAKMRGVQIGLNLAESFEIIRMVNRLKI